MKKGTLLLVSLVIYNTTVASGMQLNTDDEKALVTTLLSERAHIDTLFSKDELRLIEDIRQSFEGNITAANVDLVIKSCYYEILPVLNEHKKSLQGISKKLFHECLTKHGDEVGKRDTRRLKFITSPLPLILLVDYRFIKIFEL